MRRAQIIGAHLVIGVIVMGHAGALWADHEAWPFSPFPMYSAKRTEWVRRAYLVYGVPRDSGADEVLLDDCDAIVPWDPGHLSESFAGLLAAPDGQARVEAALLAFLRSYEARRPLREHPIPALSGLRLYETMTPLDPTRDRALAPQRLKLVAHIEER